MTNSIRLFAALGLCAALGTALAAPQSASGGAAMGGKMGGMHNGMRGGKMGGGMRGMGRMAQELGLTDAQKAKIKAMMQAQMPRMKALRENKTLTPEQKKTKMKAMRVANEKKMAAILTPAQRKKLETMMKERRARRMDKM